MSNAATKEITQDEIANAVRASKVVENNARDLQTQIENLTDFSERFFPGGADRRGIVEAVEAVQEAVLELGRYRRELENQAGKWAEKNLKKS